MGSAIPVIVVGLLVVGAIGGLIWYTIHLAKVRREEMAAEADSMGLSFSPEGSTEVLGRFGAFKLFNQGRGRKMANLIQGDSGEVRISIFDYQFTTGSGKNSHTHRQSIVAMESANLRCPDFTMRPESIFDKFGGMLGFQDIDFETHPDFSKLFVLKGSSENAIRKFFRPELIEFFESKPGISVEAMPGAMFFYRARTQIKPTEIKDQLGQAYEVFGVMVDDGAV